MNIYLRFPKRKVPSSSPHNIIQGTEVLKLNAEESKPPIPDSPLECLHVSSKTTVTVLDWAVKLKVVKLL